MYTTLNVSKIVRNWNNFYLTQEQKTEKPLCLIGLNSVGKTTLCLLFEKYLNNVNDPNLTFSQNGNTKQYFYPNIISTSSFKVQTCQPKIYQIKPSSSQLQTINIIDIPSQIIPPCHDSSRKIWNYLDSKISQHYLLNKLKSSTIALIIQQIFLRILHMQSAKAQFCYFVNMFKSTSQQLFNSTCLIISKCPKQYKLDQCIKRIQAAIKKIQSENQKPVSAWFQNLKKRNAIYVFSRFHGQQAERKQQVINIYKQITKLTPYQIQQSDRNLLLHLQQTNKTIIHQYLKQISSTLLQLIKRSVQIPFGFIKEEQVFKKQKNALASKLSPPLEKNNYKQQQSKQQQSTLPSVVNVAILCVKISNIIKANPLNNHIFSAILRSFINLSILSQTQQLSQSLNQRITFYQQFCNSQGILSAYNYSTNQNFYQQYLTQLSKIEQYQKYQQLKDSYELQKKKNKRRQFLYDVISVIHYLNKTDNYLQFIQNDCKNLQQKFKKPDLLRQLIQKIKTTQKSDKKQQLKSLLLSLAKQLNEIGYIDSVWLYSKCGDPYHAIQQIQAILKHQNFISSKYQINQFIPYLKLLQSIGLYQKSYQTCYLLGSKLKCERTQLQQFLKQPKKKIQQTQINAFINNSVSSLDPQQIQLLYQILQKQYKKCD